MTAQNSIMKIKTLIVDNDPVSLALLEQHLSHFPEVDLIAKCTDALDAFHLLQKTKIDLMFLEIEMPRLKGTDLVRSLNSAPKVVFTTASQDYAIECFELNAIDYIMKPLAFARFFTTMVEILGLFKVTSVAMNIAQHPLAFHSDLDLYLRVERRMVKVSIADIYWVESLKDYIKVFLKDRVLLSKQKIGTLEELLPEEKFVRIHRSFIVSISKIESYHSYSINILGKELPVGRNYKAECQKRLRTLTLQLPGQSFSGKMAVSF